MNYLKTTTHGTLRYCSDCKVYHLEFGNMYFNFSEQELQTFREYIATIDPAYWERRNHKAENNRKILLSTHLKGTFFCFHASELEELKYLLNLHGGVSSAESFQEINYSYCLN